MNVKRLWWMASVVIFLFPLVWAADFSLNCPAQAGDAAFTCTLDYQNVDPDNFGGFDFTLVTKGLTLNGKIIKGPESLALQYNANTGKGSLLYDFSGIDAAGTLLTIPLLKAADAGASGTVTFTNMVLYDANSAETPVQDLSAEVTFEGAAPAAEPVAPAPEPAAEPVAPVAEPAAAPISRAPLTVADLADEADADGDGIINSADADDDGDGVNDVVDSCTNTFVGAERVTANGCLEGDLGAQPDGCVNDADVSAANFMDILIQDGFDGLSSLLWGMFDNWNADEGTC